MSLRFVPFDITVCGIEELGGHCARGVTHVLSILDPEYPVPDAFGSYGEHDRLELRFHDVIEETAGQLAPREADVERLLLFGQRLIAEADAEPGAEHLLVHCHAGVSRSTAAMTLILAQARPELPAAAAMAAVVGIRPQAWPNLRMVEMGDRLLGRGGAIVAAVRERYRAALAEKPHLGPIMIEAGRGREVKPAMG
jgi:predicted protein tyrosine phosphatase